MGTRLVQIGSKHRYRTIRVGKERARQFINERRYTWRLGM